MNYFFTLNEAVPTPQKRCVFCRYTIDRATGFDKMDPDEGDVSLCLKCGGVMLFGADKQLRAASSEELAEIKEDWRQNHPDLLRLFNDSRRYLIQGRSQKMN